MIRLECVLLTVVITVVVVGVCVMVLYATEISISERRRKYMDDNVYQFSKSMGVIALKSWDRRSLTTSDRFPYVAAILTNRSSTWSFVCFGTLISGDWIVTSGHCKGPYWGGSRVLIFDDFVNNRTHTYPILQWIVHEDYQNTPGPNSSRNDISVAHLSLDHESQPYSIKPSILDASEAASPYDACVWKTVSTMDRKMYLTNDLGVYLSSKTDNSNCTKLYGMELDAALLCVDMTFYADECFLNEFGPLFFVDKLVGVLAVQPKECEDKYAIFTNVSAYTDWIINVTFPKL